MKKMTLIAFMVVIGMSCAGLRSGLREGVQPNQIPVALQPMFIACTPSDGEVQLSIEGRNTHVSDISVVWNIPQERSWEIQFNTAMGDTRMALKRTNGVFSAEGDLQLTITADRRGFMVFNDHLVPLRDNELPCVLAGRWPVSWFGFLQRTDRSTNKLNLLGQDDVREISMTTSFGEGNHVVDSCAVIQWGGFLGLFRHSAQLCIKRSAGSFSAELKGPSNYLAKWSQLHDDT